MKRSVIKRISIRAVKTSNTFPVKKRRIIPYVKYSILFSIFNPGLLYLVAVSITMAPFVSLLIQIIQQFTSEEDGSV